MSTKIRNNQIQGGVVNVFDFMSTAQIADVASGAGAIDVSAAIQAAINSKTNLTVHFPEGKYRIESQIEIDCTLKYSVNLLGSAARGCELAWYGPPNTAMLYYHDGQNSDIVNIEQLQFNNYIRTGDATLNGVVAIQLGVIGSSTRGVCNATIRKCLFQFFEKTVDIYYESDQFTFEDNYVSIWTDIAIDMTRAGASMRINNNHFMGGQGGSITVKAYGVTGLSICGNTMQNGTSGDFIFLENCQSFRLATNYTESTGSQWFAYVTGSYIGYIGENFMGAYGSGAKLLDFQNASHDITIGPNWAITSTVTNFVNIATGSTRINVLGNQYVLGALVGAKYVGTPAFFFDDTQMFSEVPFSCSGSITSTKLRSYSGSISVGASTFALVVTVDNGSGGSMYIVHSTQGAENYSATALVTCPEGGAAAVIVDWGHTNANFTLSVNGLDIRVNNGVGAERTAVTSYLRLQ